MFDQASEHPMTHYSWYIKLIITTCFPSFRSFQHHYIPKPNQKTWNYPLVSLFVILHTTLVEIMDLTLASYVTLGKLPNVSGPQLSLAQSLSRVWLFATPWIAAHQASLSITNSRSSLRLTSIESVMPSSHLILCRPLLWPLVLKNFCFNLVLFMTKILVFSLNLEK